MKDGFVKAAAASPVIRVADADYNAEKVIACIREAGKQDVKLLVFPALLHGQGLEREDVRADVRLAARWFSGHRYTAPAAAPKAEK